MSPGAALSALLKDAARLDRTQSDPLVALRNAVGVGAPLVIGTLLGGASIGLPSTIGALQTGFADRPGPYRLRLARMSATALAAGLTSSLAVLLSRNAATSALLLLVLGFVAGLLIFAGPAATQVGIASTAAALIIGHQPEPPSLALHVGLLVLLGGVGQVVLALAAWPLRRHRPERVALAGLYRALAALARRPTGTHTGPPLGDAVAGVRQTLYGLGHDHGPSVEAYRVLLDEAQRIRGELIVLAGHVEVLERRDTTTAADAARAVMDTAAAVLERIAEALLAAHPVEETALVPVRDSVRAAAATLADAGLAGRSAVGRVLALAGQLRAAVTTTRSGASEGRVGEEPDKVHGVARLRDPLATLRANLTPDSAVLRHAVRAAVLVAGSELVTRLSGIERGYWISLTIIVTLRPDFATTFQRSFMRVLGTILGLVLATALIHYLPGGDWWGVALVTLFYFGVRLAGAGNVALLSLSLSALVVVLLALNGIAPHSSVAPRAVDTLVGGALALLATLVWPVWERQVVSTRLATLLDAYREYLAALLDPAREGSRLQRARSAARLARSNAQASVDAARADPVSSRGQVELGEAVLAHSHRFVHALLTVDAVRPALAGAGAPDELAQLMRACDDVLQCCSEAVRAGRPPQHVPPLRPIQEAFLPLAKREPDRVGGPEVAAALIHATDRIANSLDTLAAEVGRQLSERAVVASKS